MNSALYTGYLSHRRTRPVEHEFRYAVSAYYLDLDELGHLARSLRLFGLNRPNLASFYDRDHMDGRPGSTKHKVLSYLASQGIELAGGRVYLLTQLRLLHYVFNPVSFYYCHDAAGILRAVVAEVDNTFGERHLYLLDERSRLADASRPESRRYRAAKRMHVSPFVSMDAVYDFRFAPVGERLSVFIGEQEHGREFFEAHLWGHRRTLDARGLAYALVRYPLLNWKVVFAIHWHALRLYWKGVPFHRQPAPSREQTEQHHLLQQLRKELGS
ncbi:MAG: DUF1365 domain-containing protein [Candidatus Binatia bacterium]